MRLSNATTADTVLAQLQRLSRQQADLQSQVATGQRITKPGDDPAAVARVIAAQMERSSVTQYARNADSALEYSKTSYAGLQQFKKLSDRAGELAVLGTGSIGSDAMKAYAAEVNQLLEQAASQGNTRFGNDYVFSGNAVTTAPYTLTRDASGQITAAAYAGDTGRLTVPLADGASIQPTPDSSTNTGLADFMNQLVALRDALQAGDTGRLTVPLADGASIQPTPDSSTNTGLADFMNQLVALRDALQSGDTTATQATRAGLDTSETLLVGSLSEHGAIQLRIEVAQAQQTSRLDELERQISNEAEVDLSTVIVRLNQTTQSYEAALSSSSTLLKMSLLDYIR
jgi:flagellar hook-associated protein 3 FlgL